MYNVKKKQWVEFIGTGIENTKSVLYKLEAIGSVYFQDLNYMPHRVNKVLKRKHLLYTYYGSVSVLDSEDKNISKTLLLQDTYG